MLIGYARVSTGKPDLALQLDALEWAGCEGSFKDPASGALKSRPQLEACLGHLRAGDTLVVWRLERLGRSLRHLIETVAELEQRDVGFKSLTEGVDTTTAAGRMTFHIFGALAEFERSLIQERTLAVLQAAPGPRPPRREAYQHHLRQARRRGRDARTKAPDARDRYGARRQPGNAVRHLALSKEAEQAA